MAEVITCIAFSPSGMTVAVCDLSKRTVVFDTTNYETLWSYIAPEPCTAIAFCGELFPFREQHAPQHQMPPTRLPYQCKFGV